MKHIYSIITLICSMIFSGCMHHNNNLGSINPVSSIDSVNKRYPIGIGFTSGDITMTYRDQKSIMGSIQYPDQEDAIVVEGYGKGFIKDNKTYHIPGLYGDIVLSGNNIIYDSGFSFLGPSIDSEWRYTRTYVWSEKDYTEEMSFMNWDSHEYGTITILPQSLFSEQRLHRDNPLEGLCAVNDDMNPVTKEEYKKIGTDKIYIAYRDHGGIAGKITTICFIKKDNLYKIEWTDKNYKKDIIESFQFLN